MGMFTTIIDPLTNKSYQIKSGNDDCETYKVGDKVKSWINPNWPESGKLFDDVYSGYGENENSAWIIIKDSIVSAIEPWDEERGWDDYQVLRDKYQIQDLPRETWSEEVWKKHDELKAKFDAEYKEFEKTLEGLSGPERLGAILARSIRRRLNYSSYARNIFIVEPLPKNTLAYYDIDVSNCIIKKSDKDE
jgi:hypothetical protein